MLDKLVGQIIRQAFRAVGENILKLMDGKPLEESEVRFMRDIAASYIAAAEEEEVVGVPPAAQEYTPFGPLPDSDPLFDELQKIDPFEVGNDLTKTETNVIDLAPTDDNGKEEEK